MPSAELLVCKNAPKTTPLSTPMSSSSINARCSTSAAFGPRCIRHGGQGKGNRTENGACEKNKTKQQTHSGCSNTLHQSTSYQTEQANPISHLLYVHGSEMSCSAQVFDAMMPGRLPPYAQSSPPTVLEEHPDPTMPLTFGDSFFGMLLPWWVLATSALVNRKHYNLTYNILITKHQEVFSKKAPTYLWNIPQPSPNPQTHDLRSGICSRGILQKKTRPQVGTRKSTA